jgi:voltage-dependent anion channel protein 2
LKIELDSHFNFNKSALSSKATISYKAPDVHARLLANLLDGPVVTGDVVAVKNGFLAGTAVAYDSKTANVTRYDATVGYANPEFALTLHAEKYLKHFSAGYIQRVNLDTEFAARVTYNTEAAEKAVGIEIGTKHQIDRTTSIKAKINNNAILGLGFTHSLQPGVKVTVGSSIDVSKAQEAAHKFGVHFVLEK